MSIDTRTLHPGDLFVALQGESGDGHGFVADALAKGAAGAMVHRDVPAVGRLLLVDDTLAGLHRLGGYARARFTGRLVAVTGSVGKTTTKEMLRTILTAFGATHAAVASYNNQWGLPLTLARMPPDATFCVAEIGMNHAGEIAPLARLARPHVAVITAVENAHIGYLGSIEAIADEKADILRALEPGGVAVLPADTQLLPRLRAAAGEAQVITFGASPDADVRLVELGTDADGSNVAAQVGSQRSPVPPERAGPPHGDERARRDCRSPPPRRRIAVIKSLEPSKPSSQSLAAARVGRSRCQAVLRCCWTKATTATPLRCARRSRCCACNPPSAASPCSATCWNSVKGSSGAPRLGCTMSPLLADRLFACGPLMQRSVRRSA